MHVIANPPIGIYTNPKTHIGHAFFLVLLDTIARYRSAYIPAKAYNIYGKRGDTIKNPQELADKIIEEDNNRNLLNLSNNDILYDTNKNIITGIQSDIIELNKRSRLICKDNDYYLKTTNLKFNPENIICTPKRITGELERMIQENLNNPIKLTRPTKNSIPNPLGKNNIGPLFTLANMWDHIYKDSTFTMAGSNSVLTKYIFLRYVCQTALERPTSFEEIIIWPKVMPEGDWNISNIVRDEFHSDMLRYALVKAFSKDEQKVKLPKSNLKGGRNFVYLVANLRKPLAGTHKREHISTPVTKHMNNLDFSKALSFAETQLRNISREINKQKTNNTSTKQIITNLANQYTNIIDKIESIIPATSKLVKSEVRCI